MCSVPSRVVELIETFDRNVEAYHSQQYNETQLRREFIDPIFEELGWDVTNKAGYAQAYKDVIHEDAIKVGGATKAPDYSFRIGGVRKFFLEAKKPSVNIKGDPHPAYQLRRYAWSAKLPLSILTDFEEFAVYDCQTRPKQTDKADTARIMYFTYKHYPDKWAKIADVFSRNAILKGSFDKFAASAKGKRGTTTVDVAFLAEIEKWRDMLARIIALRNRALSTHEINFAVQRTIDRTLFLRMCEDRGIEDYGQLLKISTGDRTYPRLSEIFEKADQKYNSGLFHFQDEPGRATPPDKLTPNIIIDDKDLKWILHSLYYPQCPYEFSVLPPEILGNVYEQFLGSVIQVSPGRRVKVVPKPEVKKAGGVYYTPSYIVDYIVKNTVGQLLGVFPNTLSEVEGSDYDCHCEELSDEAISNKLKTNNSKLKTPRQVANLRILDPACGSGSFLLGAYTYLLNYHRDWYVDNYPQKHTKKIYQGKGAQWYLTNAEKKRILLNNIFGVDIDSQAVEVTKLSLLLKVLEGEDAQTLENQYRLFHERALPDLATNIKCGNSLIGPDFFENLEAWQPQAKLGDGHSLIPNDFYQKINPFDWKAEFPHIFSGKNPGFDAVIGNPPYLNIDDTWGKGDARQTYLKKAYSHIYNDKTDILFYFLGKAAEISKCKIGFIVSRAFLEAYKADKLRDWLSKNTRIQEIIDFRNFYVFQGVGITTAIVILTKEKNINAANICRLKKKEFIGGDIDTLEIDNKSFELISVNQSSFCAQPWLFVSIDIERIFKKIDSSRVPLGSVLIIGQGMQTGRNDVFGSLNAEDIQLFGIQENSYFYRARNSDILRYYITDREEIVLYLEDANRFRDLPKSLQNYLKSHEKELKGRAAYKRGDCKWWKFTWPLHKEHMNKSKIYCPYLSSYNRFALDENQKYLGLTDTTVLFDAGQPEQLRYLLGLLNSRLLTFRFHFIGKLKSGGILEYFWNSISKLPIRRIDFDDPNDKANHDKMVKLVERMLDLHKKLAAAKIPDDKTRIQRQIDNTDKQIDKLVYQLYGLTEEEIAIIENI